MGNVNMYQYKYYQEAASLINSGKLDIGYEKIQSGYGVGQYRAFIKNKDFFNPPLDSWEGISSHGKTKKDALNRLTDRLGGYFSRIDNPRTGIVLIKNEPKVEEINPVDISKNIDDKLKSKGFELNKYNYRFGKKIDENDYITAWYSKQKATYNIGGIHKFITPLGENSVGINWVYDNENDFWYKIEEYLKKINEQSKDESRFETDKAIMEGIETDSVDDVEGNKISLPQKGFLIDSVYLKEGSEKGKGSGQELYTKALEKYGTLYSHFPTSEDAFRVQNKLVDKGVAQIELVTLSDGTELRKITKADKNSKEIIQSIPFKDVKEGDYVSVYTGLDKNPEKKVDEGLVTFKYGNHYLTLDEDNERKYNYSNAYYIEQKPKRGIEEKLNLPTAETIEQLQYNIEQIIKPYVSTKMATIEVESYLIQIRRDDKKLVHSFTEKNNIGDFDTKTGFKGLKDYVENMIETRENKKTKYSTTYDLEFKTEPIQTEMIKAIKGRSRKLMLPNGEEHQAIYAIVDLNDIKASHNEVTFSNTEGYPTINGRNINDRNYKDDVSAQNNVRKIAENLQPETLISLSSTPSGTPIINKDGFVVSGNNRVMSLKLAKHDYPKNYDAYKKQLKEDAEIFGIDSYDIQTPVLVRIDESLPDKLNTEVLAAYNQETKKGERPVDKAIKLASILNDNDRVRNTIISIIDGYDTFSDLYSSQGRADRKKLVEIFVQSGLIPEQQLPVFFDNGEFTEGGKDYIETLLSAIILTPDALKVIGVDGVRKYRQTIISSLPVLITNKNLKDGASLASDISDAVIIQYKVVQAGGDFSDYTHSQSLFAEDKPKEKPLYMNALLRVGKNIFKQSIKRYNDAVKDNEGASLFGETLSVSQIFDKTIKANVDKEDVKLIEQLYPKVNIDKKSENIPTFEAIKKEETKNMEYTWDVSFTGGVLKGQKLSEQKIESIDVYDDSYYGLTFIGDSVFTAKTSETVGLLSITENPVKIAVIIDNDIRSSQRVIRRLQSLANDSNRVIVENNSTSRGDRGMFPFLFVSKEDSSKYKIAEQFQGKLDTPKKAMVKDIVKDAIDSGSFLEQIKKGRDADEIIETIEKNGLIVPESILSYSKKNIKNMKKGKLKISDIPESVKVFMPLMQQKAIVGSEEHWDTIEQLERIISAMPVTYETDGIKAAEKLVYLHYFGMGSDWYIVEKDREREQLQAYGYVILNGDMQDAEWGYINIEELKATNRVELDFFFEPIKFGELFSEDNKEEDYEDIESESTESNFKKGDRVGFLFDKIDGRQTEGTVTSVMESGIPMVLFDGDKESILIYPNEIEHIEDRRPKKDFIYYYTTAPVDYDGFGTETIEMTDYYSENGKQVRKVGITEPNISWQTNRYRSGNYPAIKEDELQKMVDFGIFIKKVKEVEPEKEELQLGNINYPKTEMEKVVDELNEGFGKEHGYFQEARYSKGNISYHSPENKDKWKDREQKLATAKTVSGKYSNRENAYIMSIKQAKNLKKYILDGYDANPFTDELILPEKHKIEIPNGNKESDNKDVLRYESDLKAKTDYFKDELDDNEQKEYLEVLKNKWIPETELSLKEAKFESAKKIHEGQLYFLKNLLLPKIEEIYNNKNQIVDNSVEPAQTEQATAHAKEFKYYKGVNGTYKNGYEYNRAVEEMLDTKESGFTSEEKVFMSGYSGYGGLDKIGKFSDEELKTILYEFYTPRKVVEKMWGLAYKYGFKGGNVLESSVGIGEFVRLAPDKSLVTGYEINPYSAKIAKVLYPETTIINAAFETVFIKNNSSIKNKIQGLKKYNLVIGNPPYGKFRGKYSGMGEDKYTNAINYVEYFLTRGLDLLESGGLLIMIIGTEVALGGEPFLKKGISKTKKEIMSKSILVDAYRLPNGVFERTDVLSDIIVLRKK